MTFPPPTLVWLSCVSCSVNKPDIAPTFHLAVLVEVPEVTTRRPKESGKSRLPAESTRLPFVRLPAGYWDATFGICGWELRGQPSLENYHGWATPVTLTCALLWYPKAQILDMSCLQIGFLRIPFFELVTTKTTISTGVWGRRSNDAEGDQTRTKTSTVKRSVVWRPQFTSKCPTTSTGGPSERRCISNTTTVAETFHLRSH